MGNLVEIARFFDPEEAYCAKGYLLSHGIDTLIQNDHHLTMAPWLRIALNGYGLQVTASKKNEATKLLREVFAANDDAESQRTENSDIADGLKKTKRNWFWFPVAFLSIPFVPLLKPRWTLPLQFTVAALWYAYAILTIESGWLIYMLIY